MRYMAKVGFYFRNESVPTYKDFKLDSTNVNDAYDEAKAQIDHDREWLHSIYTTED